MQISWNLVHLYVPRGFTCAPGKCVWRVIFLRREVKAQRRHFLTLIVSARRKQSSFLLPDPDYKM